MTALSYHLFCDLQEAKRSKEGKAKHSQWRNYDDLNEYFWYYVFLCLYEFRMYRM